MNYAKQNRNENSHPALKIFKCWVLQFCLFLFNFLLSKLTNQFESIMQNKPNFRKAKMNISYYITEDYENQPRLRTPPEQTQFIPAEGGSNPTCSELVEPISKGKKPRSESLRHRAKKNFSKFYALAFLPEALTRTAFIAFGDSGRTPPQSCPAFCLSRSFAVSSHQRQAGQVRRPPPADLD